MAKSDNPIEPDRLISKTKNTVDALLAWCAENGIRIHPALRIVSKEAQLSKDISRHSSPSSLSNLVVGQTRTQAVPLVDYEDEEEEGTDETERRNEAVDVEESETISDVHMPHEARLFAAGRTTMDVRFSTSKLRLTEEDLQAPTSTPISASVIRRPIPSAPGMLVSNINCSKDDNDTEMSAASEVEDKEGDNETDSEVISRILVIATDLIPTGSKVVQIPAGKILSCRNVRLEEGAILPEVDQLRTQYSPYRENVDYSEDNEDKRQYSQEGVRNKSGYGEFNQDGLARRPSTFTFPLTRPRGRIQTRRSISTTAVQQDQDEEATARLVYSSFSMSGGGANSQPLLLRAGDSNTHAYAGAQLYESEYQFDYTHDMHGHADADGAAKINAEGNLEGYSTGGEAINAELALALALLGELHKGPISPWWGYLQSLPIEGPQLAIFWADDDEDDDALQRISEPSLLPPSVSTSPSVMKQIADTELDRYLAGPAARGRKAAIRQYFDHTVRKCFPDCTWPHFRHAYSLVSSRAFWVDAYHGLALVPIADAFNHAEENQVHLETDWGVCRICGSLDTCIHDEDEERVEHNPRVFSTGSTSNKYGEYDVEGSKGPEGSEIEHTLDMVSNAPILAGEEVYNTYDERGIGNVELLCRYGFLIEGNAKDIISFEDADIREVAQEVISQIQISSSNPSRPLASPPGSGEGSNPSQLEGRFASITTATTLNSQSTPSNQSRKSNHCVSGCGDEINVPANTSNLARHHASTSTSSFVPLENTRKEERGHHHHNHLERGLEGQEATENFDEQVSYIGGSHTTNNPINTVVIDESVGSDTTTSVISKNYLPRTLVKSWVWAKVEEMVQGSGLVRCMDSIDEQVEVEKVGKRKDTGDGDQDRDEEEGEREREREQEEEGEGWPPAQIDTHDSMGQTVSKIPTRLMGSMSSMVSMVDELFARESWQGSPPIRRSEEEAKVSKMEIDADGLVSVGLWTRLVRMAFAITIATVTVTATTAATVATTFSPSSTTSAASLFNDSLTTANLRSKRSVKTGVNVDRDYGEGNLLGRPYEEKFWGQNQDRDHNRKNMQKRNSLDKEDGHGPPDIGLGTEGRQKAYLKNETSRSLNTRRVHETLSNLTSSERSSETGIPFPSPSITSIALISPILKVKEKDQGAASTLRNDINTNSNANVNTCANNGNNIGYNDSKELLEPRESDESAKSMGSPILPSNVVGASTIRFSQEGSSSRPRYSNDSQNSRYPRYSGHPPAPAIRGVGSKNGPKAVMVTNAVGKGTLIAAANHAIYTMGTSNDRDFSPITDDGQDNDREMASELGTKPPAKGKRVIFTSDEHDEHQPHGPGPGSGRGDSRGPYEEDEYNQDFGARARKRRRLNDMNDVKEEDDTEDGERLLLDKGRWAESLVAFARTRDDEDAKMNGRMRSNSSAGFDMKGEKKRKGSGSGKNSNSNTSFFREADEEVETIEGVERIPSHQRGVCEEEAQDPTTEHILHIMHSMATAQGQPQVMVEKIFNTVCDLMIGLCRRRLDSMTLATTTSTPFSPLPLYRSVSSPSSSPHRPGQGRSRSLKWALAERYVDGERAIIETCLAGWDDLQRFRCGLGGMEDVS